MLRLMNIRVLGVVLLACTLAACDDGSPTGPTTPPQDPVTVEYSGAITRGGAATHDFAPSAGGTVTATITALDGGEDFAVGFALGNWFASACSLVLANDNAANGAVLSGTLSQAGPLCVRIYDVGHIEAGVSIPYTIEVVHP